MQINPTTHLSLSQKLAFQSSESAVCSRYVDHDFTQTTDRNAPRITSSNESSVTKPLSIDQAIELRNNKQRVISFLLESYFRVGRYLYYRVHPQYVSLLALQDDVRSTLLAGGGDRLGDQRAFLARFPITDENER